MPRGGPRWRKGAAAPRCSQARRGARGVFKGGAGQGVGPARKATLWEPLRPGPPIAQACPLAAGRRPRAWHRGSRPPPRPPSSSWGLAPAGNRGTGAQKGGPGCEAPSGAFRAERIKTNRERVRIGTRARAAWGRRALAWKRSVRAWWDSAGGPAGALRQGAARQNEGGRGRAKRQRGRPRATGQLSTFPGKIEIYLGS